MWNMEFEMERMLIRLSPWMFKGLSILSIKLSMDYNNLIRTAINDMLKKELSQKEMEIIPVDKKVSAYLFLLSEGREATQEDFEEHKKEIEDAIKRAEKSAEKDYDNKKRKDGKDGKQKSKKT